MANIFALDLLRSVIVKGEYNNIEIAENDQERPILITKGYSRDHRPDLKQCVLYLIFL